MGREGADAAEMFCLLPATATAFLPCSWRKSLLIFQGPDRVSLHPVRLPSRLPGMPPLPLLSCLSFLFSVLKQADALSSGFSFLPLEGTSGAKTVTPQRSEQRLAELGLAEGLS